MDSTILIKIDKNLKDEARKVSSELGLPLSTVINAFLRQFVRDKEVTFAAHQYRPTPYLERVLTEAQREFEHGEYSGPFTEKTLITHLKKS